MNAIWFVCSSERVSGPFTKDQVDAHVRGGEFSSTDLVWGRGATNWMPLTRWTGEEPTPATIVASAVASVATERALAATAATGVTEATNLSRLQDLTYTEILPDTWHYATAGRSFGPFPRAQLLEELKRLENLGEVMLWTKGMKEWVHLFEFHDILSALGVNKREFPRVGIEGKVVIKGADRPITAPTLTLSEGGLGVALDGGVEAGQVVDLEVQSAVFREPLRVRAQVRFVAGGTAGLKFTSLTAEQRSMIVGLIRQATTRFVLRAA